MPEFRFARSGLVLQVSDQGWRLGSPDEWRDVPSSDQSLTYGQFPAELLDGYESRPALSADYTFALGRVPAGSLTQAFSAEPLPGQIALSVRDTQGLSWQPAELCILELGVLGRFYAVEIPIPHQWLQLIVDGEVHEWFRPRRRT